MMKATRLLWALALLPLLLAGCGKEKQRLVEITQEAYHGGKVALDGLNATWNDGEQLRVNATTTPILRQDHNGGNYAYISADALAATNRALYPTTLAAGPIVSNSTTITLPRVYHYRTAGGLQQVEMPMAAYSTSSSAPLDFKHITGGIYFTIRNSTGHDLSLDSLTVISSNYSLSGSRTIDFTNIDAHGSAAPADAADKRVALVFDQQATLLQDGEACEAFVPVAAVGADNRFTVRATGHYQGLRCTKVLTQESGGALGRNQVAYAEISIEDFPLLPLFSGTGTETDPYLIGSAHEFKLMLEAMAHSEWLDPKYSKAYNRHNYLLTADIDMGGEEIDAIAVFRGSSFDGGGHTISNATINGVLEQTTANCALFGKIQESCTVSNLSLDRITLRYHGSGAIVNVGAVVALFGSNAISNCHATNITYDIEPTEIPNIYLGGIVGHVSTKTYNVALTDCSYEASPTLDITVNELHIGGIVGLADEMGGKSLSLDRCRAITAPLASNGVGRRIVGGIVGQPNCTLKMQHCSWRSALDITSASSYSCTGGLVGRLTNNSYTFEYDTVAGSIATAGASTSYAGAYIGRSTTSVSIPATCDRSGITHMEVGGGNY